MCLSSYWNRNFELPLKESRVVGVICFHIFFRLYQFTNLQIGDDGKNVKMVMIVMTIMIIVVRRGDDDDNNKKRGDISWDLGWGWAAPPILPSAGARHSTVIIVIAVIFNADIVFVVIIIAVIIISLSLGQKWNNAPLIPDINPSCGDNFRFEACAFQIMNPFSVFNSVQICLNPGYF